MSINPAAIAAAKEKLGAFDIHSLPYQTVNEHDITVDILVPKTFRLGSIPSSSDFMEVFRFVLLLDLP